MKNPLISVVIPVKNGSLTINECLNSILKQTLFFKMEVIIIDSGSTDGTFEIIKDFPVRMFQIKPEDFDHGQTRNYGVSLAKGEFVVFTVQDSKAASDNWLEIMMEHFTDEKVMGVCGQQIVPPDIDKNPLEWFRPYSEPIPKIIEFKGNEFEKLSGKQQHEYCGWDDVNAMYRKSALMQIPFIETNFAEDMLWAKSALSKGYKLVYDYRARVYHYHYHSFSFMFRRTYTLMYHVRLFFGYYWKQENFLKQLIKIMYWGVYKGYIPKRKIYWTFYNINILWAKYCASIVFRINSIFLKSNRFHKLHKFWVGKPPQANIKR